VTLRREAVRILGALGVCIVGLMGYMAYHEAMTLREAVGWTLAGWLSIREIMSKIENIALGIRQGSAPIDEGNS
jgi:hypothetical protein